MSKRLRAEATALLLPDAIEYMSGWGRVVLGQKWGCKPGGDLLGSVEAKLRAERDAERARLAELAKVEAEALRVWLAEVTGQPAKVRWATPRVVGAYARPPVRWAMVAQVSAVRSKPGAPRGYEAVLLVPFLNGAEVWKRVCGARGTFRTPAEALLAAVGHGLGEKVTSDEHRATLRVLADRLRAQPEVTP